MNAELGQVIDGKYRLVRLLGSGGMGAVYEGENTRIRRRVAIKMLHSSVSTQQESVTRFEREAQAAGRIGSEHICEVLDLGVLPDATRYMVMEYLEGETLSSRIKRAGRLLPLQAIPLLTQVLEGLEAAHAAGIIHRDLKPDNVWIVPTRGGTKDFVKVLDFGVSKFSQIGGEEMNQTRAGAVVGTPYYMSPEQARGMGAIDARTDIYAIGVVLYQAVTGQVPYQAETFNELLFKIVLEVAPPPQIYVPDIDPDFVSIIQRAMSREPQQRYQSCNEFRDALLSYQARNQRGPQGYPPVPVPQPPPSRGPNTWQPQTAQSPQGALAQSHPSFPAATTSNPALPAPMMPPTMHSAQPMLAASQGGLGISGVGQPGAPTATANAWGNASTPGAQPVPPKSKAGIAIAVVLGVVVLGGAAVAAVAFKMGDGLTAAAHGGSTTAAPSPVPSAAPAAPTVSAPAEAPSSSASAAPSASASASASAAPSADEPSVADEPSTAPVAGAAHPAHLGGPLHGPKPKPSAAPAAKPAAKPAGVGDLGY
ncbi:MAG TPA: serine/threonine-protein kinase [Byssovorax sp.]|jgi:serine/threonine-protein kinase